MSFVKIHWAFLSFKSFMGFQYIMVPLITTKIENIAFSIPNFMMRSHLHPFPSDHETKKPKFHKGCLREIYFFFHWAFVM